MGVGCLNPGGEAFLNFYYHSEMTLESHLSYFHASAYFTSCPPLSPQLPEGRLPLVSPEILPYKVYDHVTLLLKIYKKDGTPLLPAA